MNSTASAGSHRNNPAFQAFGAPGYELRALIARTPLDIVTAWEEYHGLWNHPLSVATTPHSYHDLFEVFEAHRLSPFELGIIIDIYHPRDQYFELYRYEVKSIDVGRDRWIQIQRDTGNVTWLEVESILMASAGGWILKAKSN